MYEEFHRLPAIQHVGEYDDANNLIKLFNSMNQQFIHIVGTYQWRLVDTDDVFFVEEDPIFRRTE